MAARRNAPSKRPANEPAGSAAKKPRLLEAPRSKADPVQVGVFKHRYTIGAPDLLLIKIGDYEWRRIKVPVPGYPDGDDWFISAFALAGDFYDEEEVIACYVFRVSWIFEFMGDFSCHIDEKLSRFALEQLGEDCVRALAKKDKPLRVSAVRSVPPRAFAIEAMSFFKLQEAIAAKQCKSGTIEEICLAHDEPTTTVKGDRLVLYHGSSRLIEGKELMRIGTFFATMRDKATRYMFQWFSSEPKAYLHCVEVDRKMKVLDLSNLYSNLHDTYGAMNNAQIIAGLKRAGNLTKLRESGYDALALVTQGFVEIISCVPLQAAQVDEYTRNQEGCTTIFPAP